MSSTALVYVRQSRHKDYERTASPEVQWQTCGELPRASRAYKDCIATPARPAAPSDQPTVKPVFSSR